MGSRRTRSRPSPRSSPRSPTHLPAGRQPPKKRRTVGRNRRLKRADGFCHLVGVHGRRPAPDRIRQDTAPRPVRPVHQRDDPGHRPCPLGVDDLGGVLHRLQTTPQYQGGLVPIPTGDDARQDQNLGALLADAALQLARGRFPQPHAAKMRKSVASTEATPARTIDLSSRGTPASDSSTGPCAHITTTSGPATSRPGPASPCAARGSATASPAAPAPEDLACACSAAAEVGEGSRGRRSR